MPPRKSYIENEELRKVRERELELKRISGDISCSDCRRLKLKCDKKIPCSSCIRRGARTTCPNGQSGASSRSSPARDAVDEALAGQIEKAKAKMTTMSERIRDLEDAVRSGLGPSHPLLSGDLLHIKEDLDSVFDRQEAECSKEDEGDVRAAFGTLSISEGQTFRYYGRTATDSVFLTEAVEPLAPRLVKRNLLSPALREASQNWPFAMLSSQSEEDARMAELISHLPPYERASALIESFFGNVSWLHSSVERDVVVEEHLPVFYPGRRAISPGLLPPTKAHELALLFITFACGAAGDLTQEPTNDEGERYMQLAKASLVVGNLMQDSSMESVQATSMAGTYMMISGRSANVEEANRILALACNLATSIGLHRDPSHWGLDASTVNRRRRLFWEMHINDTYRSLSTGRPITFAWNSVDCELPVDDSATIAEDGSIIEGIQNWRYRYSRDVLAEVAHKLCGAGPVKYRELLELDRKVRDFSVHECVLRPMAMVPPDDLGRNIAFIKLHPLVTAWDREETLLYIHRNHFARAILEYPSNPLRSPFSTSFLATYRSSVALLRIIGSHFDHIHLTILRAWAVWTMLLSSAVVMGVTASLGSSINFATSAFVELEKAISIFEKAEGHVIARHGLPLLRSLRGKALKTLQNTGRSNMQSSSGLLSLNSQSKVDAMAGELEVLQGSTRVIRQTEFPGTNVHDDRAAYPQVRPVNSILDQEPLLQDSNRGWKGFTNSVAQNQLDFDVYAASMSHLSASISDSVRPADTTACNGGFNPSTPNTVNTSPQPNQTLSFDSVYSAGLDTSQSAFVDYCGPKNDFATRTHLPVDICLFAGGLDSSASAGAMSDMLAPSPEQLFSVSPESVPSQVGGIEIEQYDMAAWQMLMDRTGMGNGMGSLENKWL